MNSAWILNKCFIFFFPRLLRCIDITQQIHFHVNIYFTLILTAILVQNRCYLLTKRVYLTLKYNIYIINTIIFSKRASISFSEVIFEESSSNGFVVDDELMDQSLALCLKWDTGARSFLLPGMRILANRSSCRENTHERVSKQNRYTLTDRRGLISISNAEASTDVKTHELRVLKVWTKYRHRRPK